MPVGYPPWPPHTQRTRAPAQPARPHQARSLSTISCLIFRARFLTKVDFLRPVSRSAEPRPRVRPRRNLCSFWTIGQHTWTPNQNSKEQRGTIWREGAELVTVSRNLEYEPLIRSSFSE